MKEKTNRENKTTLEAQNRTEQDTTVELSNWMGRSEHNYQAQDRQHGENK